MFSEKRLEDIVHDKIGQDEKLGDQVGGSGHMSFVSSSIDEIKKPEKAMIDGKDCWKIEYHYTVTVETEFTYYPDNPPYTYKYGKTIHVDDDGNLISESGREGGMLNLPWDPDELIGPDEQGKD
jgi:hypothetical protein